MIFEQLEDVLRQKGENLAVVWKSKDGVKLIC